MARTNEMVRESAADKGGAYDVLLISDTFGAAEALALGKVKIFIVLLDPAWRNLFERLEAHEKCISL